MSDWRLIVGLGNPGKEYHETRHNVGFRVLDELARRYGLAFGKLERKAHAVTGTIGGEKVILCKPQTYMNLSGEAVRAAVDFYKVDLIRVFIVSDDLDLPLGTLRLRKIGSAGGQNGLKSVIQHLGSSEFSRLRFGIGRPPGKMAAKDYVLGVFKGDEAILVAQMVERAANAVESWMVEGMDAAMNKYNGSTEDTPPERSKPPADSPADIKNFLDSQGRLLRWPAKRSQQLAALDYLLTKIESGKIYSESDISALLRQWHTFGDAALIRREMFELGMLNRTKDGTEYWTTPKTKLY
jgi:PTH1 family peptidyl-tRNA hydrolase